MASVAYLTLRFSRTSKNFEVNQKASYVFFLIRRTTRKEKEDSQQAKSKRCYT